MNKRLNRKIFQNKSRGSKEHFRQFLNKSSGLSDTFQNNRKEVSIDISDTVSEVKNDKNYLPEKSQAKKRRTSPKRKLSNLVKFFKNHFYEIIISIVVFASVNVVWEHQSKIGEISGSLDTLKEQISQISSKYYENDNIVENIKTITEIQSDLKYIQERLSKIEQIIKP